MPTMAFMASFNNLMVGIQKLKEVKEEKERVSINLNNKIKELAEKKKHQRDRINHLKL